MKMIDGGTKARLEPRTPFDTPEESFKVSVVLDGQTERYMVVLHRVRMSGWQQDSLTLPADRLDEVFRVLGKARDVLAVLQGEGTPERPTCSCNGGA